MKKIKSIKFENIITTEYEFTAFKMLIYNEDFILYDLGEKIPSSITDKSGETTKVKLSAYTSYNTTEYSVFEALYSPISLYEFGWLVNIDNTPRNWYSIEFKEPTYINKLSICPLTYFSDRTSYGINECDIVFTYEDDTTEKYKFVKSVELKEFQDIPEEYLSNVVRIYGDETLIIETSEHNRIRNITNLHKINILTDEPEGTLIRYLLSVDSKKSFLKFDFDLNDWSLVDKDNILEYGNTTEELTSLTFNQLNKILYRENVSIYGIENPMKNIDIIIAMKTNNNKVTPKIAYFKINYL